MSTLNISLPDGMKRYVERQVAREGYSTASEYVRALIREDQKRQSMEKLEAKLIEGLDSGASSELTRKDWEELRAEVVKRHGRRATR